jgi:APA family basic amino acid/polyamine antiporter
VSASGRSGRLRAVDVEERLVRGVGEPALFAIGLNAIGASLYFILGVVAGDALGLTPLVFAGASVFFVVTMLTYAEGNALHPERGGASTLARYAFDELWSFVAGWAILLDYLIVGAIAAVAVPHYLTAFWGGADGPALELLVPGVVIAYVASASFRGVSPARYRFALGRATVSLALLVVILVVGLAQPLDILAIGESIELGESPPLDDLIFATVIAAVACTGIEAASGLAAELRVGRRELRRVVSTGAGAVVVLFVGISLVALTAVPVQGGATALGSAFVEAPLLGVVGALEPAWLGEALGYAVGGVGALVLIGAVDRQMLGIGRLVYALGTNRQIPSIVSRLDARRSTPYVAILLAAAIAIGLTLAADVDMLAGAFAFGAMLAFTLAHLSVIVLRYREPERSRAFRISPSVRVRGGELPLPALLGALMAAAGWISVIVVHEGARVVGGIWMAAGLALYVVYRRGSGKSLRGRFTIPEEALRERADVEYGSILVPVFGGPLDDDVVGTAGRLAADHVEEGEGGAVLEALYVFEMPMSLPLDARVPPERLERGRRALARAKQVGEEYEGVEVATTMVRGRGAGAAIVSEARRRGVELIVLAAEPPSGVRGGAILGGTGSKRERSAGDMTRYVIEKAPCEVVLTAAPAAAEDTRAPEPAQ